MLYWLKHLLRWILWLKITATLWCGPARSREETAQCSSADPTAGTRHVGFWLAGSMNCHGFLMLALISSPSCAIFCSHQRAWKKTVWASQGSGCTCDWVKWSRPESKGGTGSPMDQWLAAITNLNGGDGAKPDEATRWVTLRVFNRE